MSSWVRYCVAVYIGLLISGALVQPAWVPAYTGEVNYPTRIPEAAKPAAPSVSPGAPAMHNPNDESSA